MYEITRYHDFSAGHRVYGHESKCGHLHGHNYRIHFSVRPEGALDNLGRVIDFSIVKSTLCDWLEENWDHKFLVCDEDPVLEILVQLDPEGVVVVPFNPTAEHMASYLVTVVAPSLLDGTGVVLWGCTVEETRKCAASYFLVDAK